MISVVKFMIFCMLEKYLFYPPTWNLSIYDIVVEKFSQQIEDTALLFFQYVVEKFNSNLFFPAWVIEFFQFIFSFIKFYIICLV